MSYTSPTQAAIESAAADYRDNGAPSEQHTTLDYGTLPTEDDYRAAFYAFTDDDGLFSFGNDPYVGTDKLTASQLWRELQTQHSKWEEGEHASDCKGDGSCRGDGCPSEDAGSWCSSVLGCLGFEWI